VRDAGRLLREAEELSIPWRDILEAEIRAERVLRPFVDGTPDPPLERLLALLPATALESWRIRGAIERLSWLARPGSENGLEARRELRTLAAYLRGRCPKMPAEALLADHFLLAYRRVQELVSILRCASRCRGTEEERVARLRIKTACGEDDARWAVRGEAERRLPRLDDAMRRARSEGFEIPRGRTEPESFLRMRELLRRRALLPGNGGNGKPRRPARPLSGRSR